MELRSAKRIAGQASFGSPSTPFSLVERREKVREPAHAHSAKLSPFASTDKDNQADRELRTAQKTVRIGGASGFWGDSCLSVQQLLRSGSLHYLVFDYLSELTMGILERARIKNASHGYALDFVDVIEAELAAIAAKGIRIISNAGGMNPIACAKALRAAASKLGLPIKIATVTGDDVRDHTEHLRGRDVRDMRSGRPMPANFLTANVYLGALPIKRALDAGAMIVVTGRCADSALTLGALMHEFQWGEEDYGKLSGGSLAGHLIECGVQTTGGAHTDWRLVPGLADIGYPIVEVADDGSFVATKPEGTGGLVTPAVISEQMLHEVGDPNRFVLPDVVCDFTWVQLRQVGENRVAVSGAKGSPPTDTYKACATYADGYRVFANLFFAGLDAEDKARLASEALIVRTSHLLHFDGLPPYTSTNTEIFDVGSAHSPLPQCSRARQVVSRITVTHLEQRALRIFSREVAAASGSWAPAASGASGRPAISPVLKVFSFLFEKHKITPALDIDGNVEAVNIPPGSPHRPTALSKKHSVDQSDESDLVEVPLVSIAYGRSGGKGDVANIAVIARREEFLPYIRKQVTAARVKEYLAHLLRCEPVRYDVPGIMAFNFVCEGAADCEAVSTSHSNPGSTYAPLLLSMPVRVPRRLTAQRSALT